MLNLFAGGVDFGTSSVDLVFNSGTTRACTQVPIVDDDIDEDDEMFDVTLTTTETGISLAPDQGMVTITDDDGTFLSKAFAHYPSSYKAHHVSDL